MAPTTAATPIVVFPRPPLIWLTTLSAQAATVFVTQSGDQSGNLGTLRDALNNRACPGDTVVIRVRRIRLQDPLVISTDAPATGAADHDRPARHQPQ